MADEPAAEISVNKVGELPELTNEEHLALITGLQQVARGEDPTSNVGRVCVLTLARIAGIELPDAQPGIVQ